MPLIISRYHPGSWWRWRTMQHFIQFTDSDVVLDAGCSDGYSSAEISPKVNKVIGVDISSAVIQRNRKLLRLPNLSFETLDLANISQLFPPGSFTKIVCLDVMEHVNNPPAILSNFYAILRDGGLVYATIPFGGSHGHYNLSPDETEKLLKGQGFQVEQLLTIRPGYATALTFAIFRRLRALQGRRGSEADVFSETYAFKAAQNPSLTVRAYIKLVSPILKALSRLDRIPFREPGSLLIVIARKPLDIRIL